MDASSITTKAVNTWLQAVRLPLTTVERVLKMEPDSAAWMPAVAFEQFEATVRERAGSVLRNSNLLEQAQLQRAELKQRMEADRKRARAEELEMEANEQLEQRRAAAEEQERRVQRQKAERAAQLERERARTEQRVEQNAAEREAQLDEAAQRRNKIVDATKRRASLEGLDAEEEALREKEKALQAKAKALKLEDEVKKTKARRKNGS